MQDTFYKTETLSNEQLEKLYREALNMSCLHLIEEKTLDYTRTPSRMSFDEIITLLHTKKCHHVLIQRNIAYGEDPYLEFGFCTLLEPFPGDYFLFIKLRTEHLPYFVKKYQLELL